jgi:hypothetical protein
LLALTFSFSCHFFVEPRSAYEGPVDGSVVSPRSSSDDRPCPEEDASFPSHLAFSWFTGFAWTGFRRSLTSGANNTKPFGRTSVGQMSFKAGLHNGDYRSKLVPFEAQKNIINI